MSHYPFRRCTKRPKKGDCRIDSAQVYHNEAEVGSAISTFLSSSSNTASLKRSDVFFTTKLASNIDYNDTRRSIKDSLKQCGLEYIDLFLLHSPYGGKGKRLECWRAVEDAIDAGEIKTGGVSNFGVKHVSTLGSGLFQRMELTKVTAARITRV